MKPLGSLVLTVAGLSLLLAGCGGQPFPQSAGTPTTVRPAGSNPEATRDPHAWLLASVQRTSTLKTARIAMTMNLVGTSDESLTASGTGEIDFARKELSLSVDGTAGDEPLTIDVRLVGGTVYARTDTEWLSTPAGSVDINTPNPASYLTYLQSISPDVRVDGHETLRGVDTIRYTADIDLARSLAHASPARRKLLAPALAMFGSVKIPAKAWIDGDGDLRKMQLSFDLAGVLRRAGNELSGAPKLVESFEFYDFGTPVNIVAPAGAKDALTAARIRAAQSDLRNALTAEKTVYVDSQKYSADPTEMKAIEPSLDWGGKLKIEIGDAYGVRDAVVCLSEASAGGTMFAIADVAAGPNAGTYYARGACPATIDDTTASSMGSSW